MKPLQDGFGITYPIRVDLPLNKETESDIEYFEM